MPSHKFLLAMIEKSFTS